MMRSVENGFVAVKLGLIGAALVLLAGVAPAAELERDQINDCNSLVAINQALGGTVPAGQILSVTLTVTNQLATDQVNNPIQQRFDLVEYNPDCTLSPNCTPNPAGAVNFQGNLGGTCAGTTAIDMGNQVNFDFVPDIDLNNGASCTVTFDMAIPNPGTYDSEARLDGICLHPLDMTGGFNSSTSVQASITVVPTLGEVALATLALLLGAGAWTILRRRAQPAT